MGPATTHRACRATMNDARRLAGGGGFEPPLPGPEPGVLPLDDPPPNLPRATFTIPHQARRIDRTARAAVRGGRTECVPQRTDDLSPRLGRKRGTFVGGMVISRPVRGSRPLRAARLETTNVPKPLMVTRRPLRRESKIEARKAFMARSAEGLEPPVAFATIPT